MTKYSAIILAGGRSSRMGQKKALLLYQGKSFIDIIIEKLKSVDIQEIICHNISPVIGYQKF